ncbi:MAG: YeeE/YedE family protein [Henriciella sp.]|nr:YeeE/YedE family protein [Henriciella sp.]
MKIFAALLSGLVFGFGLILSQMVNPAKVIAFLDVFGNWDPSLALVMGAALVVTGIGYRLVWRAKSPAFETRFHVPENRKIDTSLMGGAVLFGAGWGLVGLCPGPALTALSFGGAEVLAFVVAMLVGLIGAKVVRG